MIISINSILFVLSMTFSIVFLQSTDLIIRRFDQEVINLQKTTKDLCELINTKMIFQAKQFIRYLSNSQCNRSDARHKKYLRGR